MTYQNLASAFAITVGIIVSLGCCCPARFAAPPIVVPPPVVAPQPLQPLQPQPQQPQQNVQEVIKKNLGPNTYAGALAPKSPFWAKVQQVVQQRRYRRLPLDPFGGQPQFDDTAAEGGVLIGFFAAEPGSEHVGLLQPIYLTAQGEKVGQAYGAAVQGRPVQCLKAKPGYAVGGIDTRTGAILDGMGIRFQRVKGEKLDPADSYQSAWVGGQGGGPNNHSSDGAFVVGISGTRNEAGFITPVGSPCAVSLLLMP